METLGPLSILRSSGLCEYRILICGNGLLRRRLLWVFHPVFSLTLKCHLGGCRNHVLGELQIQYRLYEISEEKPLKKEFLHAEEQRRNVPKCQTRSDHGCLTECRGGLWCVIGVHIGGLINRCIWTIEVRRINWKYTLWSHKIKMMRRRRILNTRFKMKGHTHIPSQVEIRINTANT